jgi:hypothetical protein
MRRRAVEKLWMNSEKPVERATTKYFFAQIARESARTCNRGHIRTSFRLIHFWKRVEFVLLLISQLFKKYPTVRHRFERIIAGRCYLIEVAQVDEKRWRANILKLPGVPAAMMPFYGTTPIPPEHQGPLRLYFIGLCSGVPSATQRLPCS